MKILTTLALGLVFMLPNKADAAPLNVSVSIVPQKYFVEKIAGELANVQVMVPPGASPATYEPKPQQMVGLTKSDIYFSIGVPFESAWLQKFRTANPKMEMIRTDKPVRKIMMAHHHHHHHEHEEDHNHHHHDHKGGILRDPHIWLSPSLVRLQSDIIRDALIQNDPSHAQTYRRNHAAFVHEIHDTDQKLLDIFSSQNKTLSFFVFHPSWGYFAKDYGLQQNALEVEGKSPTPKALARAIKVAREQNTSVIFAQPEFSQKTAQTFADAIHGRVVRLSPLAYNWSENLLQAAKVFIAHQDEKTQ